MNLSPVVAIIGGCGLIGRTFVKSLLDKNYRVALCDIDRVAGERFLLELQQAGFSDRCLFIEVDMTSGTALDGAIDHLKSVWTRIDAVVNSAYPRGKNYGRKFEDVLLEDFSETMRVHLGGYFLVAQRFAIYFKEQGWGSIVNLASVYGAVAPRFEIYEGTSMTMPVEYAAIKAGIIHLTKYMASYYKGFGIRCNTISPGGVFDRQPLQFIEKYGQHCTSKGMLNPEDLTSALTFLLSNDSKFINGQNIIVDDGFTL